APAGNSLPGRGRHDRRQVSYTVRWRLIASAGEFAGGLLKRCHRADAAGRHARDRLLPDKTAAAHTRDHCGEPVSGVCRAYRGETEARGSRASASRGALQPGDVKECELRCSSTVAVFPCVIHTARCWRISASLRLLMLSLATMRPFSISRNS